MYLGVSHKHRSVQTNRKWHTHKKMHKINWHISVSVIFMKQIYNTDTCILKSQCFYILLMRMLGFIVFISSPGDHVRLTENRCTVKRFICFT